MGTGMSPEYLAAMATSYANQEGGITVPAEKLNEITEISLGFQPLGIASQPAADGSDDIAIADYFGPAICTANVKHDDRGLHFTVDWIRGVEHGVERVRIFPDIAKPGGANRAQTVNWDHVGDLWVTRNGLGDRDFFVLSQSVDGLCLVEKMALPGSGMVHSALLNCDVRKVWTIESSNDLKCWSRFTYQLDDQFANPVLQMREPVPDWSYGVAGKNGEFIVTDYRAAVPHGIYDVSSATPRLVVPGVWGTGICFLSDGSALVSRYGQSHSGAFNGLPGALVYVPARMFA